MAAAVSAIPSEMVTAASRNSGPASTLNLQVSRGLPTQQAVGLVTAEFPIVFAHSAAATYGRPMVSVFRT